MAFSLSTNYSQIHSQLNLFEQQIQQVREVTCKLDELEHIFELDSEKILSLPSLHEKFHRDVESCRLQFAQIEDLTSNPSLKEITSFIVSRLEQLHSKISPKHALFKMAKKFQSHQVQEAHAEFAQFKEQFPELAKNVYSNLWHLKGSPMNLHYNYGHRAFHNLDGFYSQNNEKAEAILLLCSPLDERLSNMMDLFKDGKNEEALAEFKIFEAIYPKLADVVFGKLWKVYGEPRHRTHPDIAHDQFGTLAFYDQHPKLSCDLGKKIEAIALVIPELKAFLEDSKFCSEQNKSRRDLRCVEVINEQLDILNKGSYLSTSGETINIETELRDSIKRTEIYRDGGTSERKAPRFDQTIFEVRPQNCVTIAHDLAKSGENQVNIMNFANSHVPGGAYLHHAGSQEEELFRCTGLSFDLDQRHHAQEKTLYPIHRTAGSAGGVYTYATPLFRSGLDHDYQLLEKPVCISIGTFAAYHNPKLDYSNPENPRLQGEELHWTKEKIRTYLKSAYDHADDTLIMGAFGCGAFANPPQHIAEMTMDIIKSEYPECFKKIVFAVLKDGADGFKHNPKGNFIPFAEVIQRHGGSIYGMVN